MALYFVFVTALVMLLTLFGFVLPALVSASSDVAVLVAGGIFILLPVFAMGLYKTFNKFNKEEK